MLPSFRSLGKFPNLTQLRKIMRSGFMTDEQVSYDVLLRHPHDHKLYLTAKTELFLIFCHN